MAWVPALGVVCAASTTGSRSFHPHPTSPLQLSSHHPHTSLHTTESRTMHAAFRVVYRLQWRVMQRQHPPPHPNTKRRAGSEPHRRRTCTTQSCCLLLPTTQSVISTRRPLTDNPSPIFCPAKRRRTPPSHQHACTDCTPTAPAATAADAAPHPHHAPPGTHPPSLTQSPATQPSTSTATYAAAYRPPRAAAAAASAGGSSPGGGPSGW